MSSPAPLEMAASREVVRELGVRFCEVRLATERLCDSLGPEDSTAQSMPCASPAKWHLAHTSWFFETFVVAVVVPAYRHYHPDFAVLFNSYYNTVGEQHPRPERGLLTRPPLEQVFEYRSYVDKRVLGCLAGGYGSSPELARVVELGLHHEQQHQELILTDIKHLFSCNPLRPAYTDCPALQRCEVGALDWHAYPEGVHEIGHSGEAFAFDNESPRHRVFTEAYELASRPITNQEYLEFLRDDGYARPELWLSDGWARVQRLGWEAPLYWEASGADWTIMTLGGLRDLRGEGPVCHVSYY